ncbi:MAG TPA: PaaI family thioesterase [Solirubrobacteraceae bacterium]|nr:PaaI family thioesterase [Solirubrobacteraceae bacterium]
MHVRAGFEPAVPFERCLDGRMGVAYEPGVAGEARASVRVHADLLGANGLLHGGVLAAMAEGLASLATANAVLSSGMAASGMSNETRVLADVTGGMVTAIARRRAQHDDLWVWDVEAHAEDGRTCALSTVVIAVRPLRPTA